MFGAAETDLSPLDQRVLVLAPVPQDAVITCSILGDAGINTEAARGVFDLCHRIEKGCAAVLIAEEAVEDSSLDVLVNLISRQPPWSDLPIIVITGSGQLSAASIRVYKAFGPHSNVTLLERPFRKVTLLSAVQSALRSRRRQYHTRQLISELSASRTALEQRAAELSAAQQQLCDHATELERRVAERTADLEETTRHLNTFCYTVAHDLRAPLRSQRGYANIISEEFSHLLGQIGCDYLAKISTAADKLDKLIGDLLAYASLRRQDLKLDSLELARVLDAVLLDLSEQLAATRAKVTKENLAFRVQAQETSLALVISNLLSNALKYVTPGQTPHLVLKAEPREPFVRLWVEDSGIGIAPEYHEKIFGVFERLHDRQTYSGTGIGLAIVRSATERMGGRCGVESSLGAGSRFWVELRAS